MGNGPILVLLPNMEVDCLILYNPLGQLFYVFVGLWSAILSFVFNAKDVSITVSQGKHSIFQIWLGSKPAQIKVKSQGPRHFRQHCSMLDATGYLQNARCTWLSLIRYIKTQSKDKTGSTSSGVGSGKWYGTRVPMSSGCCMTVAGQQGCGITRKHQLLDEFDPKPRKRPRLSSSGQPDAKLANIIIPCLRKGFNLVYQGFTSFLHTLIHTNQ